MIYMPIMAEGLRDELAAVTRRWAMFIYTPKGLNWVTRDFDNAANIGAGESLPTLGKADNCKPGVFASRLDGELSGILSPEGLIKAKNRMPNETYDQEIKCARITEEQRAIISSAALHKLTKMHTVEPHIRRFISCDPSLGGDQCVIYVWENTRIIDTLYMREREQKIVAGEIHILALRYNAKTVVVDVIGIGHEVVSRLNEMGLYAIGFNSAGKADDSDRYANLKSEAWWRAKYKVATLEIDYPEDEVLRSQISAVKYTITHTGKLINEDKAITKKTLGCSPDRADAWIMGLWVLPKVEPLGSGDTIPQSGVTIPDLPC